MAATRRFSTSSGLAQFKVPRDVEFVDSLPRNETGNVLERALT